MTIITKTDLNNLGMTPADIQLYDDRMAKIDALRWHLDLPTSALIDVDDGYTFDTPVGWFAVFWDDELREEDFNGHSINAHEETIVTWEDADLHIYPIHANDIEFDGSCKSMLAIQELCSPRKFLVESKNNGRDIRGLIDQGGDAWLPVPLGHRVIRRGHICFVS